MQCVWSWNIRRDREAIIALCSRIPDYSGIVMHNEQKGYTIVILSNPSTIEQTKLFAEVQQVIIKE